jgi:capsid portal protein
LKGRRKSPARKPSGGGVKTSTKKLIEQKANGRLRFEVINLASNINFTENKTNPNTDWYPFGNDNLFPQYLADLKRKSSTHRAILSQKATYSSGTGITTSNVKLAEYIKSVNVAGQSLKKILRLAEDDYYTFGNCYVEFVQYDGGLNMYHVDATQCRVHKNLSSVYIHPNWANVNGELDLLREVPMYPNFEGGRSIMMLKDYESEFQRYGIPDYIAAATNGAIEIDYLIQRYNHSKFQNGFMPSAIIEIDGSMSDDEAEQLISLAQDKLTGENNNSKILFLVKEGNQSSQTNVTVLDDNKDGSFMEYQELTRNNIVTAHRWQPALSGIVSSGKMNNTGSEIRISYDLVMRTVIKDTTEQVFEPIRDVLGVLLGLDTSDLEIQFESPISFASDISIQDIADINELRKLVGLEERPDLDDVYLNKTISNDGGNRL